MRALFHCAALLAAFAAPAALAHTGDLPVAGFVSGFLHPWAGADHLLAMTGVGLWSAWALPRRVWLLPLVFIMVMAVGGALGAAGVELAATESGIATSVLLLGALVAAMARLAVFHAAALVGLFALFHGHAHGAEMAAGSAYVEYAAGFLLATAALHLFGLALGRMLLHRPGWYRGAGLLMGGWGIALLALH